MDIRAITPTYAVSKQIHPDDLQAIREAGFKTVICNRPDGEIPEELHANVMAEAAKAAGLAFEVLPMTMQTMSADNIAKQFEFVEKSDGPVLAYCASGNRCSIIWALNQVGKQSVDDILEQTANAGYDLSALRGALG